MKHVEKAVTALAVLSALFTVAFVAYSFVFSPQNPVATEIHFEAYRVAQHFPLYVDPWKGAWEMGAPPSRYYVLYTPIFPYLVGTLSMRDYGAVMWVGRTIAVVAWLAIYIPVVAFAPKDRRRVTLLAALLGASVYFISRHGASMSPDTLATALVCGGVLRAVIKDELDPIAAMLLIAAPFVKPSCLGGVAGAAVVLFALRRPGWLRGLVAGLGTFIVFVGLCQLASDGAWIKHITSSTGQPLTLTRWVQEMGSRIMLLGIPHAFIAWLAWRRKTTWLVVGPLLGSLAWATFMMAKHGSGSHYWFEPTGLAIIAISRMPAPAPGEPAWIQRFIPVGALAFALASAITSWPQYLAEPGRCHRYRENLLALREATGRPSHDEKYVVSSDFAVEMDLNHGHISVPMWQSAFLARNGKFPRELWQQDLVRPEVGYVAIALDPRLPPGPSNDEQVELSPFYDILKEPLFENFELAGVVGGMFLYERKTDR